MLGINNSTSSKHILVINITPAHRSMALHLNTIKPYCIYNNSTAEKYSYSEIFIPQCIDIFELNATLKKVKPPDGDFNDSKTL